MKKSIYKSHHQSIVWVSVILLACIFSCNNANKDDQSKDNSKIAKDSMYFKHEYGNAIEPLAPLHTSPKNKFAQIIGWKDGHMPTVPPGYLLVKFADNLNSPRNIYVAPNGDIFVSQARTVKSGEDTEKVDSRNIFRDTSPDNILVFKDTNKDGIPESQEVFLSGLSQPYGMLVLGDWFYVANTDGLLRFPYNPKTGKVQSQSQSLVKLPAGGYNNHWTRNIIPNHDGSKIFIAVGSAGNVGEEGMDKEIRRAAILEINPDGSNERIFGSGLRNPVGIAIEPSTNILWTAVNERDELGDALVPDYITSVTESGFYGWPYFYWGKNIDPRWEGKTPDSLAQKSLTPDYAIGAHTASLGLAFSNVPGFKKGAFIGQHGSWNRSELVGYKVAFVPFADGKPNGQPQDLLSGFIADREKGEVYGRPVAVTFTDTYLLVTDDAANVIWAVLPE